MTTPTPLNPGDMQMGSILGLADEQLIREWLDRMLPLWDTFIQEHQDISNYTVLMATHNAHKVIVDHLAEYIGEFAPNAVPGVYQAARDTWSQAMEQRMRSGPPPRNRN